MSVTAIRYVQRRFRGSIGVSAIPTSPSQTAFEAPKSRSASMKSLTQALDACRSSLVPPPHRDYDGNR
ncbi:hypothetical protein, partial [Roseibium sp. RKSG952]|uniref:hypothetical protein n=1 Tax=Roseibium sp. RKSG952 TaxID=2529384 RepID=UPI001AD8BEB3